MVRIINDEAPAYRLKVTYQIDWTNVNRYSKPDNLDMVYTSCYGPYSTKGTAKAQLKRQRGRHWILLTAEIQQCAGWNTVDNLIPIV